MCLRGLSPLLCGLGLSLLFRPAAAKRPRHGTNGRALTGISCDCTNDGASRRAGSSAAEASPVGVRVPPAIRLP